MNFQYQIRQASGNDLKLMQELLQKNNQKTSIVINECSLYLLAQSGDKIIGMIGSEISGHSALIRSASVLHPWRSRGIGSTLVEALIKELKGIRITELYLFSRDSGKYWQKQGFTLCDIHEIIDSLANVNQVVGYMNDNSIWTDVAWHKTLK